MYNEFSDRAEFYVVYIAEAHPDDEWQAKSNLQDGVILRQHRSFTERRAAASSCAPALGLAPRRSPERIVPDRREALLRAVLTGNAPQRQPPPALTMTALRVVRAAELQDLPADQPHWLIEPLWGATAVGVIGGAPKSGKTFLALELAVAVASGRPCLGRFAVPCPGPVLVLAAEDSPHQVKRRIQGIAHARGADFAVLDVRLILDTALRLDRPQDLHRLHLTLASQRPKLLILDPFVRLQRADENDARQVAAILAALRELAVSFNAAVLLVHHARKSGAAVPGQALRGSGDFWAWGDSNLYLSGRPNRLRLTVEHRAAPPPAPLSLHLLATDHPRAGQPPLVRLELQDHPELSRDCQALPARPQFHDPDDPPAPPPPSAMTFAERIVAHLRSAGPTPHRALRATLRVRDQSLSAALRALETAGHITRTPHGWTAVH